MINEKDKPPAPDPEKQQHFLPERPAPHLPEAEARGKVEEGRGHIGVNAAAQPFPRSASGWHPKVFVKTFG